MKAMHLNHSLLTGAEGNPLQGWTQAQHQGLHGLRTLPNGHVRSVKLPTAPICTLIRIKRPIGRLIQLSLQELWEKEELESYFCICIFRFARLVVDSVTCSLCLTSGWMCIRSMWMRLKDKPDNGRQSWVVGRFHALRSAAVRQPCWRLLWSSDCLTLRKI